MNHKFSSFLPAQNYFGSSQSLKNKFENFALDKFWVIFLVTCIIFVHIRGRWMTTIGYGPYGMSSVMRTIFYGQCHMINIIRYVTYASAEPKDMKFPFHNPT